MKITVFGYVGGDGKKMSRKGRQLSFLTARHVSDSVKDRGPGP